MIIFGFGKNTKKIIGQLFQKTCAYCNSTELWQLCIIRTWFTLFFIPVIPYKKRYCVSCPKCGAYIELSAEQFEKMKLELLNPDVNSKENAAINACENNLKYAGKTETQINYLKQMEELNNKQ
jgi:hypothetical protein